MQILITGAQRDVVLDRDRALERNGKDLGSQLRSISTATPLNSPVAASLSR